MPIIQPTTQTPIVKMIDLNGAVVNVPESLHQRLLEKGWQLAVVEKEQPIKPPPPEEVRDFLASQQKCCEERGKCSNDCKDEGVIIPTPPEVIEEPEIVEPPKAEIIEPAKPKEVRKVIKRKRK